MFTIQRLIDAKLLEAWTTDDGRMPLRQFYHTGTWLNDYNSLPHAYLGRDKLSAAIPVGANLEQLLDDYVSGAPAAQLSLPHGHGIPPLVKRMRHPHEAVIELRTYDTRTFGFFSRANRFVAVRVGLTDVIKDQALYTDYANQVLAFLSRVTATEIDGVSDALTLITD